MARTAKLSSQEDIAEVTRLRLNEAMHWDQIAEAMGAPQGIVMLAFDRGQVSKKEKIKDPSPQDIVRLRTSGLSWGKIMARTDMSEAAVRKLFEEGGHQARGNRIGKGGRHPGDGSGTPSTPKPKQTASATKAVAAAKKAVPAKKAAAPAATPKSDKENWDTATAKSKIEGKTVQVQRGGGKTEDIQVVTVVEVKNKVVTVTIPSGANRMIKLSALKAVKK